MITKKIVPLLLIMILANNNIFSAERWFSPSTFEFNDATTAALEELVSNERYVELTALVNSALGQRSGYMADWAQLQTNRSGNPIITHLYLVWLAQSLRTSALEFRTMYALSFNMLAVVLQAWIDGIVCRRFSGDPAEAATMGDPHGANAYYRIAQWYGAILHTLAAGKTPTLSRLISGSAYHTGLQLRLSNHTIGQWPSPYWVCSCTVAPATGVITFTNPDALKIAGARGEKAEAIAQWRKGLSRLVLVILRYLASIRCGDTPAMTIETLFMTIATGNDCLRTLPADAIVQAATGDDFSAVLALLEPSMPGITQSAEHEDDREDGDDASDLCHAPTSKGHRGSSASGSMHDEQSRDRC